jgi:hypothetical protein
MGTSGPYGGPGGGTPLVPSWVGPFGPSPPPSGPLPGGLPQPAGPATPASGVPSSNPVALPAIPVAPPTRPASQQLTDTDRFRSARGNFSTFAGSGGGGRASLGRAISQYVSKSSGGARRAAQRMGASRGVGARLYTFLADAQTRGAQPALRVLNLQGLAGQSIENVFLGLADYICPSGGTIDEGIARDAFIETIGDLATIGITDLNSLSPQQINTVFEIYATRAIEARIANEIGTKCIALPTDVSAIERVEAQLRDFIRRGVSDALAEALKSAGPISMANSVDFVTGVYELAFEMLQTLGEAEAEA